ncbi:MAG TPA: helix-turn-helix domain-containing protein [Vitreimonas sp.]|nr:helix-turn-helix domain-containing protein [Vitreimonas sp.]
MECKTFDLKQLYCPTRDIIDLIGDRWSIITIHALEDNVLRYNEIQRRVEGISQKVLTHTLRNLEKNGLLKRKIYPVIPPKVEYSLTPLGKSLIPVFMTMTQWAEQNFTAIEEARATFNTSSEE